MRSASGNAIVSLVPAKRTGNVRSSASDGVSPLSAPIARSGPTTRKFASNAAMTLSMSVATTSLPPKRARKPPAIVPQAAPPSAPAASIATMATGPGPGTIAPTTPAASPPMTSCPSAPMLKKPARNAKATASAGKSSDVACTSVSASWCGPPRLPRASAAKPAMGFVPATSIAMHAIATSTSAAIAFVRAPPRGRLTTMRRP